MWGEWPLNNCILLCLNSSTTIWPHICMMIIKIEMKSYWLECFIIQLLLSEDTKDLMSSAPTVFVCSMLYYLSCQWQYVKSICMWYFYIWACVVFVHCGWSEEPDKAVAKQDFWLLKKCSVCAVLSGNPHPWWCPKNWHPYQASLG